MDREKVLGRLRKVSMHSVSSRHWKGKCQSEYRWVFRRLRNVAEESACLIVCGRAFQSLGAELVKATKSSSFLVCFSVALGIRGCGWDDGWRNRAGIYHGMSSCKYSGAKMDCVLILPCPPWSVLSSTSGSSPKTQTAWHRRWCKAWGSILLECSSSAWQPGRWWQGPPKGLLHRPAQNLEIRHMFPLAGMPICTSYRNGKVIMMMTN